MCALLIGRFGLRRGWMLALVEVFEIGDLGIDGGEVLLDNVGQFSDFHRSVVEDGLSFCN